LLQENGKPAFFAKLFFNFRTAFACAFFRPFEAKTIFAGFKVTPSKSK